MILKGSQRAGGMQLARHLLNTYENDHVTVHEIRGFVAEELAGAFKEAFAISRGTRCKQFLFSLSLSPPETETVPVSIFESAITDIEEKIGLQGQPRAIVFHEKEGRRHAHCVWSRINAESMTAINLPHFKLKLRDVSRQLYLDNNWQMPSGLANSEESNPLDFTRAEWQQSKRVGLDPRKIKEAFQDCWAMSDGQKAFQAALEARGYYLAQGDRRGFVAVDWRGEVYAISRYVGVRTKEVRSKLGEPEGLPTVAAINELISEKSENRLRAFKRELVQEFEKGRLGLDERRKVLVARQRNERKQLSEKQQQRQQAEARLRAQRFRKGLAAVWDWVTGRRMEIRKQNESELAACMERDRQEQENTVQRHLDERRMLQRQIVSLRNRIENEYLKLTAKLRPDDDIDVHAKRLRQSLSLRM